jgi:hypothetical protein
LVIYLFLAYWLARSATPQELQSNYTIMVDRAAWGPCRGSRPPGATFSSGLASLVGAPRILQALGAHGILPRGTWLGTAQPGRAPQRHPHHRRDRPGCPHAPGPERHRPPHHPLLPHHLRHDQRGGLRGAEPGSGELPPLPPHPADVSLPGRAGVHLRHVHHESRLSAW